MVSHLFPHKLSSSVKETCHCLDSMCKMTDLKSESCLFFIRYLEQASQKNEKTDAVMAFHVMWIDNASMSYLLPGSRPRDCSDIYASGQREDGIYSVFPTHYPAGFQVFCDMTTDGGGWTVSRSSVSSQVSIIQYGGAIFGGCFRSPLSCFFFFFAKYI